MTRYEATVRIKTVNALNHREHHMARVRRVKRERVKTMISVRPNLSPLLVVTLTRVGPRELDSDGVVAALKAVRDGVAARLRVDDGTKLVHWEYAQERGEPAVRVVIEPVRQTAESTGWGDL